MKTKKSVVLMLLSVLLVTGMLFTGCPAAEDKTDDETTIIAEKSDEIAQNPNSMSFTLEQWEAADDADKTLTVTLSEKITDPAFQWYSRTSLYGAGTKIQNATADSYLPVISAAGDYYYYVIVTGTVFDAATEEDTTKSIESTTAWIKITSADDPAPTQFKIGDTRVNYVRGVGGTGAFMFRSGNGDASPDADAEYIDLLMGTLGANILRIMVQDDYENYVKNTVQSGNKNIFYHDAKKNFFAVIRRVNEYGGYVFANPWTAPAKMKDPQNLVGDGTVLRATGPNYVDYADHLRSFLTWLNTNKAPIFAIGILNEPDFGGTAGYEGMGMTGAVTRDWFKTVGNFTTEKVTNRNTAAIGNTTRVENIIPGYGGGKATHHVLAMSGDSMGDIAGYMDDQLEDSTANNYIELMGRHYYASTARYSKVVGTNPVGAWADRPQLGYAGPKESEALAASPQMYAPGSTAGNIKREVWQTEHDFNFGISTTPPTNNMQTYWNSAFAPLLDIDWCLRVNGESVYDWWYSSSFSGFVTGPTAAGFPPHTITPRGKAFAHYARYVNETWFLPINKTRGDIAFNVTGSTEGYSSSSTDPKISAFEDVNGEFITIVMYTPCRVGGTGGSGIGGGGTEPSNDPTLGSTNVGRIAVELPNGFTAASASAIRSYGHANATGESWDTVPNGKPRYWIDEPVLLSKSSGGSSVVEVTLPGGNIISIMVKGTWPGRDVLTGDNKRVRPYTVQ